MKEFVTLDKYGPLYVDRVLFESYVPVIFTCISKDGTHFICVCYQSNENGLKWVLGKTDCKSIIKLLRNEITLRQILEYSQVGIIIDYKNDRYEVRYRDSSLSEYSAYLPEQDSYLFAEVGEFDDEIAYFLSADQTLAD